MPRKAPANVSIAPPQYTLQQYVDAFCEAPDPPTRGSSMRLSKLLAEVVGSELRVQLPGMKVRVGEKAFGGSSRRHHLDIFVSTEENGMQIGIDVKGLNSSESVGKNWNNRIGDLHEMANNHHQKFPYAVLGGVLALPDHDITPETMHNIVTSATKLGGRRATADSYNVLECMALLVINKKERKVVDTIPPAASPLRYERFASTIAEIFHQRH